MRKSTLVLSAAAAAMAASTSWLWTQWRDERAVNLDLRARVEALTRHEEIKPAAASVVASSEALPDRATKAVAEAPTAVSATAPAPMANYPRLQQRLLKNPKFRQAFRNQQRVVLETEFRDLPKFLNLSPGEADRVFDMLAEQGVSLLELQWRGPGNPKEGLSRQDSYRDLRKQNDAELTNLLGGANMNRFQEFRSTLQSRAEVASVRNEMALGPDPLREDQVEPMIGVVNAELQRMNQELRDLGMTQIAGVNVDQIPETKRGELAIAANQRIVDAAGPILTNAQLAALKELYRRQRMQMETQSELNRLRAEAMISDAKASGPN
jgi:uncharacterized protein YjiS (DUF1127 family)